MQREHACSYFKNTLKITKKITHKESCYFEEIEGDILGATLHTEYLSEIGTFD